jgi:hypothetical protein
MNTPTNPHPEVPLLAGVAHIDGWYTSPTAARFIYRFIYGVTRVVPRPSRIVGRPAGTLADVTIGTVAVQLGDGAIDDGRVVEEPLVFLSGVGPLTTGQARQVSRLLMSASYEPDGWTR